jgi:hypothetical protein
MIRQLLSAQPFMPRTLKPRGDATNAGMIKRHVFDII